MKTSITFLTDSLGGHGGEETVLRLFCNYLKNEYTINLIIPEFQGNAECLDSFGIDSNQILYNLNLSKLSKFKFVFNHLFFCKTDFLIVMTPRLLYFASMFKKIFHKKYIIISWQHFSIFRPTEVSSFKEKKRLYQSADYYWAISSGIKKELSTLGVNSNKIYTIYNPVIQKPLIQRSEKHEITHFLVIARIQFERQKNLKELFDACSKLKGKWVVDIYGNDDSKNNEETKKCVNYIEKLGISDKVIWHGWYKDVWSQIKDVDCLVLTSNFEGFPMSLCEAVSHGIPLISSDCPTGPNDIVNPKNGFLYKMHNIPELANLMQDFIDGHVNFNGTKVQQSVSHFYIENYVTLVKSVMMEITKNNR